MSKMPCPVERKRFMGRAKAVRVVINGVKMTAPPKQFSTGSFGWYLTGKLNIEVKGVHVPVQVGLNLTVIGSKDLPK